MVIDLETIHISKRITEHSIEIPKDARVEWISIDPQFKILKEIKSIKIRNETNEFQLKDMLKNQLRKGKTIIERIEAALSTQESIFKRFSKRTTKCSFSRPFLWSIYRSCKYTRIVSMKKIIMLSLIEHIAHLSLV